MDPNQCQGVTKTGEQCKRTCPDAPGLCFQHDESDVGKTDSALIKFLHVLKDPEQMNQYEKQVLSAVTTITSSSQAAKDLPGAITAIKLAFPPLLVLPDRILGTLVGRVISSNAAAAQQNVNILFAELHALAARLPEPDTVARSRWTARAAVLYQITTTFATIATKLL
jgi:hypothetical protein